MSQQEATSGDSYANPCTRRVGLEFFEDAALGYDAQDFEAVKALEGGESVSLDSGDHAVARIE